jgi:hypothetical protein
VSDWNADGLHDSYDEPHEFGIDLDGGGDVHDLAPDDSFDGLFDLKLIDLADILGASLTDGLGLDDPGDGAGAAAGLSAPFGAAPTPAALPRGDAFYDALGGTASVDDVRAWVAGLVLTNPFGTTTGEAAADPATDTAAHASDGGPGADLGPAAPEGTTPDTAV